MNILYIVHFSIEVKFWTATEKAPFAGICALLK